MNPVYKLIVKWDDCLTGNDPSIIRFAKINDVASVIKTLRDDPSSIADIEPGSGMTALHYAASNRNLELAKALLERHPPADVWKEDAYGRTAIKLAIDTGRKDLINLLNETMFPDFHHDEGPGFP